MRDENLQAGRIFEVKMRKTLHVRRSYFWKLRCWTSAHVLAWNTLGSQKAQITSCIFMYGTLSCHCGAKNVSKSEGLRTSITCPERAWTFKYRFAWQVWDSRRGFAKMHFACQEQYETHMSHRPDFLRGVALWSIRSSGLLRWFRTTGAALRMTWLHL